ncbi:energy-coupling factor ABC transporter substrate-binding protein [Corynebacterium vitaeruminis]|uniref:energy-coupling factor ABC transporter substrate-binding protein n=1 Tax=Corynebacterium vitaeruminis TaxID=38305 RepID=UPI000553E054|nr:energy-coupling factor ABC transporter substrate-binding protein [Corynebacterium vitaeruminis]
MKKNSRLVTITLIALAVVIAAFPMFFHFGSSDSEEPFGGTDAGAETIVEEHDPGYEQWFHPLAGELPGEVESGLFALQAALGAGVLGFALGNYRGRNKREKELLGEADAPTTASA